VLPFLCSSGISFLLSQQQVFSTRRYPFLFSTYFQHEMLQPSFIGEEDQKPQAVPVPAGGKNRLGTTCLTSRAYVLRSGFHNHPLQRSFFFVPPRLPLANQDDGETKWNLLIAALHLHD